MAETPPSNDDYRIAENRAAVEQAEGILMFVHGIDGDHAFHLLRSQSRTSRVKLRLLAEQFINDVSALTFDERLDMQSACTHLLLTAHERVRRDCEGA